MISSAQVGFSTALSQIFVLLLTRAIFRFGNRRRGAARRGAARLVFAACWLVNLAAQAVMAYTVVAYGYCFDDSQTRDVFYAWCCGLGISWLVTEERTRNRKPDAPLLPPTTPRLFFDSMCARQPIVIVLLATLPSLCKSQAMSNCMDRMQEMGLDMDLIL